MSSISRRDCARQRHHFSKAVTDGDPTLLHRSLSTNERATLRAFRTFSVTPGVLLCFHGTELKLRQASLTTLADKGLLITERFPGAYSLTEQGYAVMISSGASSS